MYLVTKKVKGHSYLYAQHSYREGGKVRTAAVYLGQAAMLPLTILLILLRRSVDADYDARFRPPGKVRTPRSNRARSVAEAKLRTLYGKNALNTDDARKFAERWRQMPGELRDEITRDQRRVSAEYHAATRGEKAPTREQEAQAQAFRDWGKHVAEKAAADKAAFDATQTTEAQAANGADVPDS